MHSRIIKAVLAATGLFLMACQVCLAQEEKDRVWMHDHFPPVLDELLPIEKQAVVSFRSQRELYTDMLEYSCSFMKPSVNGRVEAVVRMADTISLYDQMMALHLMNPAASAASLKSQLKAKQWRLTEGSCPSVKVQFEKYEKLRLPVVTVNYFLVMHPTVYDFQMKGSAGSMILALWDAENPLVRWANDTRRALNVCTESRKSRKGKGE
jgi:hypothetical protein